MADKRDYFAEKADFSSGVLIFRCGDDLMILSERDGFQVEISRGKLIGVLQGRVSEVYVGFSGILQGFVGILR